MVARGDLGIDCPLEDVPHLQKRIIRHCVAVGQPGDHGDADARVDDPRADAHPGRGQRRGQRGVRRHRRRHAVGRDGDRRRPGRSSWRRWPHRRAGRERGRATASGPSGWPPPSAAWDDDAADRITEAVTHAAWQAAIDVGATAILCCTRSGRTARAMARFRPDARMVGLSPDPRTVRAADACRGASSRCTSRSTAPATRWCGSPSRRRWPAGYVDHGDIVLVLAGAPDRGQRRSDRRPARGRASSDGSGRRGGTRRAQLVVLVHGSMDRVGGPAASCRGASTPIIACCATTGAATAARAARRSVRDRRAGRRPRRTCSTAARRSSSATPTAATSRSASPTGIPNSVPGRRRVRDAAVVARLVAGDDGRRRRAGDRGRAGRRRRAVHAPTDRRRAVGPAPESTRAARRAEGAAMVGELTDLRSHAPWEPSPSACRSSPCTARSAPRTTATPTRYLAERARRLPGRRDRRRPPLRAEHPPRRRRRRDRRPGQPMNVTSRPKNRHVVSSTAPAVSVSTT